MSNLSSFQDIVNDFYDPLYRFALSLAKNPHEAADLTQQTFFIYAEKHESIKDSAKTKSWLFTTLYREFLRGKKRGNRISYHEPEILELDTPSIPAKAIKSLETQEAMNKLQEVDEIYRVPLSLFYLGSHSYKEIATIIDSPIGTVMSRIARGKAQLKQLLVAV